MKTFIVKDIKEFLCAITDSIKYLKGRDLWWRGQSESKPEWKLRPKIYREGFSRVSERGMTHRFTNKARIRYPKCPDRDDYSSWLFLMQHYGLPTRLLDWSESPLIALYFAVQEDGGSGIIWGLEAGTLNKSQINQEELVVGGHPHLQSLFEVAFQEIEVENSETILAILTDQFDLRHMVQSSVFTLHGISTPLNELDNAKDFLVKIEIPQKAKLYFKQTLSVFGIKESFLFPDLEHLSKELKESKFIDTRDSN